MINMGRVNRHSFMLSFWGMLIQNSQEFFSLKCDAKFTLYNVCSVHRGDIMMHVGYTMSTLGDVQYIAGYHEYIRGIS